MRDKKVCIIGSGITGLLIGAMLSKKGHIVEVYERNSNHIGGHARTIKHRNHSFCMGPQYVWNFSDGDIGMRVLDYLGLINKFKLKKMKKNGFEKVCFENNDNFIIPMGLDSFCKKLINEYPLESESILSCFDKIKLIEKACNVIHDSGAFLKSKYGIYCSLFFTNNLTIHEKLHNFRYSTMTVEEFLNNFDISDKVKKILFANSGIFAENMKSLSLGVFVAALSQYHNGAFVPVDGFNKLIDSLVNIICENRGKVELNSCVTEIKTKRNNAVGIFIANKFYNYDIIISNISPYLTSQLLKRKYSKSKFAPTSNSLVTYLVGLSDYDKGKIEQLINQHIWYVSDKLVDYKTPNMLEKPTMMYIGASQDKSVMEQSIILYSPGNILQEKEINKIHLKKILAENALEILISCIPDCEQHIEFIEVYLPSEIENDIAAENGNVYGKAMSVDGFMRNYKKKFKIKNLYISCASTGLPGVATACMSSSLLFNKLSGEKIYE